MRINTRKSISVRFTAFLVIVAALTLVFALTRMVFATDEAFAPVTDKTIYEGQQLTITDLQINGTGNDMLSMNLYASNGSMQFINSDGLTFDGPSFGSDIQFSGTRLAINAALANLRYNAAVVGEHTIEATLGGGDYWADNGHVYTVIADTGISWQDAKVAAETMEFGGVNGYLATITSQEEHDFILDRINDSGWIGANDVAAEGVWRWETGPEAGSQFWFGDDVEGYAVDDAFTNWNEGEPNNSGDSEDCGQIWFSEGSEGQWNDLNCDSDENEYYVVEFGEEGDLPIVATTDFGVTVNEAPEIAFTGLSPADNSEVAPTDTISITFNQPMELGEGYVRVFNAADDSQVAELWSGETEDNMTFTFDLPDALEVGNDYYVTVSDSFFEGLIEYYHGFSDETIWSFSVIDTVNGDLNGDGIQDSTQDNVGGYTSSYTGKKVAIDVGSSCGLTTDDMTQEVNFGVQDPAYEYENGLWAFEADCGTPGFTTTIKLYYYDIDPTGLIVRKHNPATNAYFTLTDATIEEKTLNGNAVVVVTYQITDGGERDVDATANGEIVDPVGLAAGMVGVPNTGLGAGQAN